MVLLMDAAAPAAAPENNMDYYCKRRLCRWVVTWLNMPVDRKDVKGSFFDGVMILSSIAIEDHSS